MRRFAVRFLAAGLALGTAAVAVAAYGLAVPTATLLAPALVRLPGSERRIALTFDDGPSVPYTAQILDILKRERAPAVFFLCGANAARHPELVRRILREGHQIGNHTYSHPYLHLLGRDRLDAEIGRAQDAIAAAAGAAPRYFRPPFGVRAFALPKVLRGRGLTMVLWSGAGPEGDRDARAIAAAALKSLSPGAILLFHDGFETAPDAGVDRSETVKALPAVIAGARRAGYTFTPLPES